MRRRIAWTRLTALAMAACLIAHATMRTLAHVWLGEAAAFVEIGAALLLTQRRTRALGVIVGAAALALFAMAEVLAGEMSAAVAPLLFVGALLALGKRIDNERNSFAAQPKASETLT